MPTIAVIGASRGIGKELAHQLSSNPSNKIFATMRSLNHSLFANTPNITILTLDQTDPASIAASVAHLNDSNAALDTLILNSAMGENEMILPTSPERLTEYLDVNVVGIHRVVQAFLPALRRGKGKQIVYLSSVSGSLELQVGGQMGFAGPYSVSKVAGNMLMVQLHRELNEESFTIISLHPGWVATDMGNSFASGGMKVEDSVSGIVKLVGGLKTGDSGKFFSYDGSTLPW